MRNALLVLLGVLLLLAAASPSEPTKTVPEGPLADCAAEEPPSDAAETGGTVWLSASTTVVRPGQMITIRAEGAPAANSTKGIDAYLECWTGTEWVIKFLFVLGGSSWGTPTVTPYPPPGNWAIPAIGLAGASPEPILLPSELPPGWYRIRKQISLDGGPTYDPRLLYRRIQVQS